MHDGDEKLRYTLKKSEILRKEKWIKELFSNGSSFFLYPIKLYYLPLPEITGHQVLFSVPKKIFKNAVDRNKIKRRLREAYRLNKPLINAEGEQVYYCLAIVYISKLVLPLSEIEPKLIKLLRRLKNVNRK